jgi:CheY-like chemotaxis protein
MAHQLRSLRAVFCYYQTMAGKQTRVLAVDDEPEIMSLVYESAFGRNGIPYDLVTDADEAVTTLFGSQGHHPLVIIDALEGYEMVVEAARITGSHAVIFTNDIDLVEHPADGIAVLDKARIGLDGYGKLLSYLADVVPPEFMPNGG